MTRRRRTVRAPEHQAAHSAVFAASRDGRLPPRTTCQICAGRSQVWHHHSYEPEHHLDVVQLCGFCHRQVHAGVAVDLRTGLYRAGLHADWPAWWSVRDAMRGVLSLYPERPPGMSDARHRDALLLLDASPFDWRSIACSRGSDRYEQESWTALRRWVRTARLGEVLASYQEAA